jgi:prepilin-type N-terminal cleavage/methylation domain-containing protein
VEGMRQRYFTTQHGLTLIELIIGMSLMLMLLTGILNLFSDSIKIWISSKNQTHIQQTARIAMDTIAREIRYAHEITFKNASSLVVLKEDGQINTLQLGGGLHSKTLYIIIDKSKAIPAGGISSNPVTENVIASLQFTPYPQNETSKAVLIALEVIDESTGGKKLMHTACYPLNINNP